MIRRWFAPLCLLLAAQGAHADEPPRRVISLNLCTDSLVLALLPPERVVMLSNIAADPLVSPVAAQAQAFPRYDGRVETLLRAAPDLVLAGAFAARDGIAVLARLGYRVEVLDLPETIPGSLALIERVGALLGAQPAAATLRARTERRLDAVRAHQPAGALPLALVYLPNGLSPGRDTLKDELLRIAGWRNLAAERGISGFGTVTLESIVRDAPDLLLYDTVDLAHASLSRQTLLHPALGGRIRAHAVPSSLWMCGGPEMADAAELLDSLHRRARPD
jgi:iron complex transport system substrate-binding protein